MPKDSDSAAELLRDIATTVREERRIVHEAKPLLGSAVGRRIDVRISISSIEAITYALKQLALAYQAELPTSNLSPEEILALRDLQVDVDKQGKVSTKSGKFGLYGGVRLALRSVATMRGFQPRDVDFGSPGGQAFARSIAVRDRLTHPKALSSFDVTDIEIDDVTLALKWFGEHVLYALSGNVEDVTVPNAYKG